MPCQRAVRRVTNRLGWMISWLSMWTVTGGRQGGCLEMIVWANNEGAMVKTNSGQNPK